MRPGRRLLRVALLWALLALAPLVARWWLPAWAGPALLVWLGTGLALLPWAADDALRLRRRPTPAGERRLPAALAVGVTHPVELRLDTGGAREDWEVADHHPSDDGATGLPKTVRTDGDTLRLRYPYRPSRRGTADFGDIEIWLPSPRRLWQQRRRIAAARQLPVYPDFSPIARAALAVDRRHGRFGRRPRPRGGDGLEFQELRDYQPGDSPRRIDWKASARRSTLITRHYQEERNQTVWILLDGGRRMGLPVGELTAFDHGLNAALLLAWAALRGGDRAGALLFSGDRPRWIDPVHGQNGIQSLLRGVHDLHPGDHASDFSQAARYFDGRWRRRALVVILTRLHAEDSDDLLAAVRRLGRRHRVLIADLQLPEQEALRRTPPEDLHGALRLAADAWDRQHRDALHTRLRHAGAHLVAATPDRLAEQLGRAYHHLSAGRAL